MLMVTLSVLSSERCCRAASLPAVFHHDWDAHNQPQSPTAYSGSAAGAWVAFVLGGMSAGVPR